MKTDNGRDRPPFSLRERLEAEFLLQFASKLEPGEVLEVHYSDHGMGTGYKVGFAGMFAAEFVVDGALDPDRIDGLLGLLRSVRRQMAAFARDLAAVERRDTGRVIATDYIGGAIAALLFEEQAKAQEGRPFP